MGKHLPILLSILIILLMFATPGNMVKAAELTTGDQSTCGCHDVTILQGAEMNTLVAHIY